MYQTFIHKRLLVVALMVMFCAPVAAVSQEAASESVPGPEKEVKGVIVDRAEDGFTVRDFQGEETKVTTTDQTEIEEKKINPFRGAIRYSEEDLLPGLQVRVEGPTDGEGRIVAKEVKFSQNDLAVAHAIQSRVDPVSGRLREAESRFNTTTGELRGNIEELGTAFGGMRGEIENVQEHVQQVNQKADSAVTGVKQTNERITRLDEYEEANETTIHFAFNSSELSDEAKAALDGFAGETEDKQGLVIEIRGFASSDGNEKYNQELSHRRAQAVANYLTVKHEIAPRQITFPVGFGAENPVADNSTREGRQKNRRVEVRMLLNTGLRQQIEMTATESPQTTDQRVSERRR